MVEYVDYAGIAERTRERIAQECVETPERAMPADGCAGLRQYAAAHDRYADERRAGSKLYKFEVRRGLGGWGSYWVTYEQMLACTTEQRVCPEKHRKFDDGRWSEALDAMMRIINLQRARGNK